jgi:3-oxoacyl-[acyl-carrier protein] reductase
MSNSLDGKVAVVTGAGRGLGRAEAIELARQGARVVINDIGVALDGSAEGKNAADNPADEVVETIRAEGGEAIAHFGDAADFDAARGLVELAVNTWGSLDIVVNNAGVLRDRMLFNMTEEEWDLVVKVHLKGHFVVSRWAAAYWRDKSKHSGEPVYARVVNTTSEAGLLCSPGQPNYSAAKAGIMALTVVTANSIARLGGTANAIAPRARTRMTEGMEMFHATEGGLDVFAPENVSPLVAWLAGPDSANVSGQVFIVWGRQITVVAGPTADEQFETSERWTPERVGDALAPFYAGRTPITDGYGYRDHR